jgi:hypothetical protein
MTGEVNLLVRHYDCGDVICCGCHNRGLGRDLAVTAEAIRRLVELGLKGKEMKEGDDPLKRHERQIKRQLSDAERTAVGAAILRDEFEGNVPARLNLRQQKRRLRKSAWKARRNELGLTAKR